ncbi:PEP-CTERM sorting domain-containing protein [Haloferula sp. BvORR071]|uniref:PEP-CTERM sorting domain-containing protein n=1 Tax=Haloferula sp. BvORR071 TaxID=1396141 RepID=UPI00054DA68F|nr:PEP-CTERM sorting domain-containing protein [Haloferula sp. BvORR071]
MKFTHPVLLLALAVSLESAQAVVVNFDFNLRLSDDSNVGVGAAGDTYQGLGAAPDSATNTLWNSVRRTGSTGTAAVSSASGLNNNPPGGGPIRDSSGLATTIDVILGSTTGAAGATGIGHQRSGNQQELGLGAVPQYEDLMADYMQLTAPGNDSAANVGTVNGTINGLSPGAFYEIYFYGQGANYSGAFASTTSGANSLFGITDALGGSVIGSLKQTGWTPSDGVLTEGVEYVKFTANANATGEIFFMWQNVVAGKNVTTDLAPDVGGGSTRFAALNAIQVVSVPEPSAALLGGLGVLSLALRRRRI